MNYEVKVFDIGTAVSTKSINDEQKENILKIFEELMEETHLITNCYLDLKSPDYEKTPLYYFYKNFSKGELRYDRIAEDLLEAECKADNTRNSTIREGLLFIKAKEDTITIMKLEKLTVIDKSTYEIKSELGKEKDYFKVCIFHGDFEDIKIIDKNKTAAKYWYETFLGLARKRKPEDNTKDVIRLIKEDALYVRGIVEKDNYKKIKTFTEYYLFDNKKFDKSDLFNGLNSSGLIEIEKEELLFSESSKVIDSDFEISEKEVNAEYQRKI